MTFKVFGKEICVATGSSKTVNTVGIGFFSSSSVDYSGYPIRKNLVYNIVLFNRSFYLILTNLIYPKVAR